MSNGEYCGLASSFSCMGGDGSVICVGVVSVVVWALVIGVSVAVIIVMVMSNDKSVLFGFRLLGKRCMFECLCCVYK